MRRSELQTDDVDTDFDTIAFHAPIGHLGITTADGYPRVVPLNFAHIGHTIYFHGALDTESEKFNSFSTDASKVTFSIDIPYSFIPSHWSSKEYACPATHFFKSIFIRGKGRLATDPAEKAKALQKMMEKYQPEGKYREIIATDKLYTRKLETVAVFVIDPVDISIKLKFGQNESPKVVSLIIAGLTRRQGSMDNETIKEILRLHPKVAEIELPDREV